MGPRLSRVISRSTGSGQVIRLRRYTILLLAFAAFLFALASEPSIINRGLSVLAVLGSLGLAVLAALLWLKNSARNGKKIFLEHIPKSATFFLVSVFIVNFLAVGLRFDLYPFYSVSMFNWIGSKSDFPSTYVMESYAYLEDDQIVPINLRLEGSLFENKILPWNFLHTASFSASFHNRTKQENHRYLELQTGKKLFVVAREVDLRTGQVSLVDDFCGYQRYSLRVVHYYGELYIPDWQKRECQR